MTRPLEDADRVLLIDTKGRQYLVTLAHGSAFHSHNGIIDHDDLIGLDEGTAVATSKGSRFHVLRPTLSDFVLKMKRGAQVIYPKDLGPLLLLADVFPGARILESGVGSGALSMPLLRAGAQVTGYELRSDFVTRARRNVEGFLGEEALGRYDVQERDCYEGIDLDDLDRVVLDLPEPWRVVPHAVSALRSGGVIVGYTTSLTQAAEFRRSLDDAGFLLPQTIEVLNRSWHIEGQSVRPDHRMVAHTGFLTQARAPAAP